eukprot:TRINITY_DN9983_c0_g1_i17.p1 TRINITY_DN9983_c0_g1~~TRINITY_DN9983_c0_g1_i17.p1  ORF type:complete len:575 (-),score=175.44 TRINITY_DN9983_c0_g1_i17:73-1710(-)
MDKGETPTTGKVDGEDNEKPEAEEKKESEAADEVKEEDEDDDIALLKEILAKEPTPGEMLDEDDPTGKRVKDGEDGDDSIKKIKLEMENKDEEDKDSEERENDDETMRMLMEEGENQDEDQEENQKDEQPNLEETATAQPEDGSKEAEEDQKEGTTLSADAEVKGAIEEAKETAKEDGELKEDEEEEEDVKEEPAEPPVEEVKEEKIDPTDSVKLIEKYIRKSRIDISVDLPKNFENDKQEDELEVKRMTYGKLNCIMDHAKNEKIKNLGLPSVMTITPNFIVIGTTTGMVRMFDYNQSPVKGPIAPSHKEAIGRAVTCVDVNRAGTHLVFGYDTGLIALWDIAKWSGQKIEAGIHTKKVLSMRFLGSDLKVVSADVGGDVKLTRFKKGFMGTSATVKLALRECSIVSICLLESGPLSSNEAIADYVALVSKQGVRIANIGLTTKAIWNFKCPPATKNALPYADWSSSEEFGDDNSVLAIGCDRMIQFVSINHNNLDYSTGYQEDGYFETKEEIIGLKWLTGGVIAVLTAGNNFCLLYTSDAADE